jgi:hypothetical protein
VVPTSEGSRRRSGAPRRPVVVLGAPAHREVAVRGRDDGPTYATQTRRLGTSGPTGEGALVGVRLDDDGLLSGPKQGRPARVRVRHVAGRGVPGVSGRERRWKARGRSSGRREGGTVVETAEGGRGAAPVRGSTAWRAATRPGARRPA